jgi:hypothetical protein
MLRMALEWAESLSVADVMVGGGTLGAPLLRINRGRLSFYAPVVVHEAFLSIACSLICFKQLQANVA